MVLRRVEIEPNKVTYNNVTFAVCVDSEKFKNAVNDIMTTGTMSGHIMLCIAINKNMFVIQFRPNDPSQAANARIEFKLSQRNVVKYAETKIRVDYENKSPIFRTIYKGEDLIKAIYDILPCL